MLRIKEVIDNIEEGREFDLQPGQQIQFSSSQKRAIILEGEQFVPSKEDFAEAVEAAADAEDEEEIDDDVKEFLNKWQITPGQWAIHSDHGRTELEDTEEMYFETESSKELEKNFQVFWDKQDILKKYKKTKRAYLLHSRPGTGKSALIRNFCRKNKDKDGLSVITVPGDTDYERLTWMFAMPYNKDVKSVVLVIEDLGSSEQLMNNFTHQPAFLNFLDGVNGLFKVPTLVVITTNFPDQLPEQIMDRPGRINKKIEVAMPSDDEVCKLVENIMDRKLTDAEKEAFIGQGLTPDHCVEAVVRSELESIPLSDSVRNIRQETQAVIEKPNFFR